MKTMLHLTILMVTTFAVCSEVPAIAQAKPKYVCVPCGQDCDTSTHVEPGVCPTCKMELVDEKTISFENIDFARMCERIKANKEVVLLDVRTKEEFAGSHATVEAFGRFRNALNINIYELKDRIAELAPYKDKEVIVYCSHNHRSPQASYFLATHGFKNVKNVIGGVSTIGDSTPKCINDEFIVFPSRK